MFELIDNSSMAVMVYNDQGKEKTRVFHVHKKVATSVDEARKTSQGSKVLDPARKVTQFTNISFLHYGGENAGTADAADFD